ncbi:hypothetical protein ASPBRDRAFT_563364 [Aspergillus brasiliensis CBS 101740]|uniref:Uncharacterized protein n=1 Tax=Aspergillus brasiliensis (strain CBS 101740 / IMI 381727 / IBT 21946) TaxID=767769 RepID=A0A1L9UMV4_ASPBC|nr:hypothetical protein ASPBRDRAFT_563364 [Aspergillus brasiliensis CBS 101740]
MEALSMSSYFVPFSCSLPCFHLSFLFSCTFLLGICLFLYTKSCRPEIWEHLSFFSFLPLPSLPFLGSIIFFFLCSTLYDLFPIADIYTCIYSTVVGRFARYLLACRMGLMVGPIY